MGDGWPGHEPSVASWCHEGEQGVVRERQRHRKRGREARQDNCLA